MVMFTENTVVLAFLLTLFAGLATGIGGLLALLSKKVDPKFIAGSLGFSTGVMLYIAFVDFLKVSEEAFSINFDDKTALIYTTSCFFLGILIMGLIDYLIPCFENPHEMHSPEEMDEENKSCKKPKLYRVGIFTAIALAIHNVPEGLVTFIATLEEPMVGLSVALAIAIHNIPEGIAVSVPIYHATKKRRVAFFYSLLSGAAEPIGGVIGYILLINYFNSFAEGIVFAFVAGIMVFISLDELLPSAEKFHQHHVTIYGLIAGMATIALSLILI
jgi:ZIP family zinc transporter